MHQQQQAVLLNARSPTTAQLLQLAPCTTANLFFDCCSSTSMPCLVACAKHGECLVLLKTCPQRLYFAVAQLSPNHTKNVNYRTRE
jgi:hypothetical protein